MASITKTSNSTTWCSAGAKAFSLVSNYDYLWISVLLKNILCHNNSDYNVSEKMYATNDTTVTRAMLRENAKRMAKKDWQQFFFPMCFYAGVMFDLSNFGADPVQDLRMIMVSSSSKFFSFSPILITNKKTNKLTGTPQRNQESWIEESLCRIC